jgi:4-amino-4-deoxy-L-arabinose transferase-like glycosyltransferase
MQSFSTVVKSNDSRAAASRWGACSVPVLMLAVILLFYGLLAVLTIRSLPPGIDEGYFAGPALNLAMNGSMGTPVLRWGLKDIDRYTYWIMPLHAVVQAAWYKVMGFDLVSLRALSLVWGLIAIAAWFFVVRVVSGSGTVAVLAVGLLGTDYIFVTASAVGRMDMMSAALNFLGLALYFRFRARRFTWAVFAGHAFVSASAFTHPIGGMLGFVALAFVTVYYDRAHLRWRHAAIAGLPYLAGGLCWGAYIWQNPSAFVQQFLANTRVAGRLSGFSAPWMGFVQEITGRYFVAFGLGEHSAGSSGPVQLKVLALGAYVAGLLGCALTPKLRREQGARTFLVLIAVGFVLLALIDGQKAHYYLVHLLPIYTALLALWVVHCARLSNGRRLLLALCVAIVVAVQTGGIVYRGYLNNYARSYIPAIRFVRQHWQPGELIVGNPSLAFGLGFFDGLVFDPAAGHRLGLVPKVIVLTEDDENRMVRSSPLSPELREKVRIRLTEEYEKVYERLGYRVYLKRKPSGHAELVQNPVAR